MSTWDAEVFAAEANTDFLDELSELELDEVVEAVRDAVLLARGSASAEELQNGLAAATIAAIWAGAPFSAGEVADSYEFIRGGVVDVDEELAQAASAILESADTEEDIDPFIEALS
ncbi:hypothetical protein CAPI_02290 [Corynebacterium capitovis DSM 44611]|uniref:hypothetical protein n=1 Tax=Corynebacterium capitovis TaxID=131081 RepID=UPI00036B4FEC|nr:hypothetical protein [Corynebacterium capitovis]WKD57032.1 hypothetical protein CAPI_02290 [Corynebacterium capitovis DSM 44611]